jgi:hypothetical protein
MKNRLVQTLAQGDNNFGQVSHPDDLMKAQVFSHERISDLLHDFVNSQQNAVVSGLAYELDADNALTVTIKKPGRIVTKDGISYDLLEDAQLEFETSDVALPRVDMIVGKLDEAIDAELDLIPFVQLRTADEFSDNAPPYTPTNISAPRERHWRIVPQIKTGTPGPTPSTPVLASNEIPLYIVTVAAGASQIRQADVIDVREIIRCLEAIDEELSKVQANSNVLAQRITRLEILKNQPIDLSQVFGEIKTLGQILAELQKAIVASRDLPEIRYDRLKAGVSLSDPESAQIIAVGNTDGGAPCVDIPVGGRINFGDAEVIITPYKFDDQTLNARFVKTGGGVAHEKRSVQLTLENCTQTAGDGFIDFLQRGAVFSAARGRPAAAARDEQFVEIFGGLAPDNDGKLGDWLTYDVLDDTLTPQVLDTVLPESDRPALFPFGDGTHMLLVTASESTSTPQWWKINTDTWAVTEIVSTKPTGISFYGDLISTGKVLIVATRKIVGGFETDFWEYNTGANTFTQLVVTGSVPDPDLDCSHGCFYEAGKFMMVTFDPILTSSGRTYIFDRSSLQWTEMQHISQPYGGPIDKQLPLARFRMANINGRPLLVGGLLTKDTDTTVAKVWELSKSINAGTDLPVTVGWISWDATFPPVQDPGFCSTIGVKGLPDAKAFFFAGHGKYSNALTRIYSSVQGGLIATTYNDQPGVSIAPTSTFVQFEVPPFVAAWQVAAYLGFIVGSYDKSTLKAEVSFDDGVNWHEIDANGKTITVDDGDDPSTRRLRITLYQSLAKPPRITVLNELLDQDGQELEDRVIIRFELNFLDPKALYIDRKGVITLSTTIEPSTPEKALILKVTPDGPSDPPLVRNYINRRSARFKYRKVTSGVATTREFDNELAVPVRYINATAVDTDGKFYFVDDPDIDFDSTVTLAGDPIDANDTTWMVEIGG